MLSERKNLSSTLLGPFSGDLQIKLVKERLKEKRHKILLISRAGELTEKSQRSG